MNISDKITANEEIDTEKLEAAKIIISGLQKEIQQYTAKGHGPFLAALYNSEGKLIAKEANTVKNELCSNNHAEMNVIAKAEKIYGTHDLSKFNLKLYITSEPCMMCIGAIMWSGIREVYYGVPSKEVEIVTGFDEGFKPNWLEEFKQRGIPVYGNIAAEEGIIALKQYVDDGNEIYKPSR